MWMETSAEKYEVQTAKLGVKDCGKAPRQAESNRQGLGERRSNFV